MKTTTETIIQNTQARPEMVEVEPPRLIQFSTGDCIDGLLVSIERLRLKDGFQLQYTVQEQEGNLVCFWGLTDLNRRLRPEHRGHWVSIRCEGEDTMVGQGDNRMKVFRVLVSKQKANENDLYITDSNVAF